MATFSAAYAMKERMASKMLKHPKVFAIGVGYYNPKKPQLGAAVTIYTNAFSPTSLGLNPMHSMQLKGKTISVPIRLVRTKRIRSHADYKRRIRPVIAGYSIGTKDASGTLGLIVARGNQKYMLSNNHVLTNPTNTGTRAETLQPGGADGGQPGRDRVGWMQRFVQLKSNQNNFIDAALSIPVRNSILSPRYATVGVVPGHVTSYRVGERFKKVGRTTGLVHGTVDSINTDVEVDYGRAGTFRFKNQTIVTGTSPVSNPGDSGSVWLRRADNFAAAVNYAGSGDGKTSVSFPIDWAMKAFQVKVARPKASGMVKAAARDSKRSYIRPLTAKELAAIRIIQGKK